MHIFKRIWKWQSFTDYKNWNEQSAYDRPFDFFIYLNRVFKTIWVIHGIISSKKLNECFASSYQLQKYIIVFSVAFSRLFFPFQNILVRSEHFNKSKMDINENFTLSLDNMTIQTSNRPTVRLYPPRLRQMFRDAQRSLEILHWLKQANT